jgi:hypothetical protein
MHVAARQGHTAEGRRHPQRRRTRGTSHGAGSVLPHPPEAPATSGEHSGGRMSARSAGNASTVLPSPSPPGQSCGEAGCRCQHRQPASPARKMETAVLLAQQFPEPVPSLSPGFWLRAARPCLVRGCAVTSDLAEHDVVRRGRGRCRARRTRHPADHRFRSLDPLQHQQLGHMKVRNLVRQPAARREHLLASCPSKRKEHLRQMGTAPADSTPCHRWPRNDNSVRSRRLVSQAGTTHVTAGRRAGARSTTNHGKWR